MKSTAKITVVTPDVQHSFEVEIGRGRTINELERNIQGIFPEYEDRFQKTGEFFYGIFAPEKPPMFAFAQELKIYMETLNKTDYLLRDDIDFLYVADGIARAAVHANDAYAAGIIETKVLGYLRSKKFFIPTDVFDAADKFFMPVEPVSRK